MKYSVIFLPLAVTVYSTNIIATDTVHSVSDTIINQQRSMLRKNTEGKGFGPQSPRDIDSTFGKNVVSFSHAPSSKKMNLCNIHFHKNAEHKGGEFTTYAGNGNGHGYLSGYKYSGHLSKSESIPVKTEICASEHGSLEVGDTIEVHYVYSTAAVKPGPTLDACFNGQTKNPQLRVETQVYILVNDKKARSFSYFTEFRKTNDFYQAVNIPDYPGKSVEYIGSTTGPDFNTKGSPFQVTWNVRTNVEKVNAKSVDTWCKGNIFKENHAHGVRNLIIDPNLLSKIK